MNAAVVLPEQQQVVSAAWDRTIKVWNLNTRKSIYTLKGHTDRVNSIAALPNK